MTTRARGGRPGALVAGVRITSPDRVLYPDQGVTKIALAEYYAAVGERMLPHVAGRPLSVVRCPSGRQGQCFYQKHLKEGWPEAVYGIELEEKSGETASYLAVRDVAGLVSLVQYGVLEVHPWGSREEDLEHPDRLVFDLDPGPGVDWSEVVGAARRTRDTLLQLGLQSFVRTTGGKGLHVVLPIEPQNPWKEAKSFCSRVAHLLEQRHPERYVTNIRKEQRQGRILIDYLRNERGATAIASYSPRARANAPVATELSWEQLGGLSGGDAYTIANMPRRLAALGSEPWEGFFELRQGIDVSVQRLLRKLESGVS